MKSIKILCALLAAIAMILTGCKDDDTFTGVDKSLPGPVDLVYDDVLSTSDALVVNWKKGETTAAGATSYTIQLAESDTGSVNQYGGLSAIITPDEDMSYSFSGLTPYKYYYARVRANYPGSVFSPWVYINLGNPEKKYAVELGYGMVDLSLPSLNSLTYNSDLSSTTSIGYNVDGSSAASASATNLLIMMDSKKSSVADVTNLELPSSTSTIFSDLTNKTRYTTRGRALYSVNGYTVYSDWYIGKETIDGTVYTIYEVGKGPVQDIPPVARLRNASTSTLTFEWSSNDFSDVSSDLATPYKIALYNDAACSDMIVSWDIPVSSSSIYGGKQTRFLFSGLDQGTKYYFKVTDENTELTSDAVEGETEAFTVVEISDSKADVGDVILAEDFSELIWGGDMVLDAPGYSSTKRGSLDSFLKAEGEHLTNGDHYYYVPYSTEVGLFNTMAAAVANSRLKNWGAVFEGPATSYVCGRPGYIKLGASSYMGDIATPELSSLPSTATVRLTFKAARYSSDATTAGVNLLSSSTVGDNNALTVGTSSQVATFNTPTKSGQWDEYSFDIQNVTPTSRISIGATREDGSLPGNKQHRMFVDDIQVQILSIGGTVITLTPPVISDATATSDKITVTWGAVDNADGYSIEYKKSSDSEWTVAGTTDQLTFDITGLEASTSYDIRVQATASGDNKSEYSEVKTVSTTEAPKSLSQKGTYISSTQIGVEWSYTDFADYATDYEDTYTVAVYKDAECTQVVYGFSGITPAMHIWYWGMNATKGNSEKCPSFLFGGLTPSTDYWVKVIDETKSLESVAKYTTEASKVVTLPTTASAGDVILYEDFGEFLWGCESVRLFPGYSYYSKATYTSITNPEGISAASTSTKANPFVSGPNLHMGLFKTLAKSIESTRLTTWGEWVEDDNPGAMCVQNGCLKVGASSRTGDILTPELSCLTGTATIQVEFDAAPYREYPLSDSYETKDPLTGRVDVFAGGTALEDYHVLPIATTPAQTQEWTLSDSYEWQHFTITVSGVAPNSRIGIGGNRNGVTGQHRMYIDNIQVKVVKYE